MPGGKPSWQSRRNAPGCGRPSQYVDALAECGRPRDPAIVWRRTGRSTASRPSALLPDLAGLLGNRHSFLRPRLLRSRGAFRESGVGLSTVAIDSRPNSRPAYQWQDRRRGAHRPEKGRSFLRRQPYLHRHQRLRWQVVNRLRRQSQEGLAGRSPGAAPALESAPSGSFGRIIRYNCYLACGIVQNRPINSPVSEKVSIMKILGEIMTYRHT